MITVKLEDLKNMETGLTKILSSDLPVRMAHVLARCVKPLRAELNELDESRNKLITKYATEKKEDGNMAIAPGTKNMEDFLKDYRELVETTVEIPVEPIKLSDIPESVKISPIELSSLMESFVIDDINSEKEPPVQVPK